MLRYDKKSILNELNRLNKRQVNFILQIIKFEFNWQITVPNNRDYLIAKRRFLELTDDYTKELIDIAKISLVDSDCFSWFEHNLRTTLWVYSYLNRFQTFGELKQTHLTLSEGLIFSIDLNIVSTYYPKTYIPLQPQLFQIQMKQIYQYRYWDFDTSGKAEKLQDLKISYKKYMLSFNEIKWLNQQNEEQIYWAEEYLQKHNVFINSSIFIADSIKQKYQQILASLDFLAFSLYPNSYNGLIEQVDSKPAVSMFLNKMRKAWSQKKFRDKKEKKSAFEILFSNKTKKKLKAYAEESNQDVISFLNIIIDEKLKEKRMEIIHTQDEDN